MSAEMKLIKRDARAARDKQMGDKIRVEIWSDGENELRKFVFDPCRGNPASHKCSFEHQSSLEKNVSFQCSCWCHRRSK